MKTAISIPTSLFKKADQLAKKLGISRSELYSRAVADWMDRRHQASITAQLNHVYSRVPSGLDPALKAAQRRTARRNEW